MVKYPGRAHGTRQPGEPSAPVGAAQQGNMNYNQFQPQQYYPNNTNYAQPPPHPQYPNDGKNWYQPSANYNQGPYPNAAPQYGYCEMGGEHDIRYHTKGSQWLLLLVCPIVCFSGRDVVCKKCKKKLGEIN